MIQDETTEWQKLLQKKMDRERREKKIDKTLLYAQLAIAVIVVFWIGWSTYHIVVH